MANLKHYGGDTIHHGYGEVHGTILEIEASYGHFIVTYLDDEGIAHQGLFRNLTEIHVVEDMDPFISFEEELLDFTL
jgi:hypothetical protein